MNGMKKVVWDKKLFDFKCMNRIQLLREYDSARSERKMFLHEIQFGMEFYSIQGSNFIEEVSIYCLQSIN